MFVFATSKNKIVTFDTYEDSMFGVGIKWEDRGYICDLSVTKPKTRISQIATGQWHFIVITEENEMFGCGSNEVGQLGLGEKTNISTLTPLMTGVSIRQVACGTSHTVVLTMTDELFVFGDSRSGRLGLGHKNNNGVPTLLMKDQLIRQIVCGGAHTMIIKENGEILVWGENEDGQLGLGDCNDRSTPQLLMKDDKIRQIACGYSHTVILRENNEILVFGHNFYGQLGLGHNDDQYTPHLLMKDTEIHQIAAGANHTVILKQNNDVLVFGKNYDLQLGLGYISENGETSPKLMMSGVPIRQIHCGSDYTAILKDDGQVLVCGKNRDGKLGISNGDRRIKLHWRDIKNYIKELRPLNIKEKIELLPGLPVVSDWDPEKFQSYTTRLRTIVHTFLLVHKRNQQLTKLTIPKFVRFEIFKFLIKYY